MSWKLTTRSARADRLYRQKPGTPERKPHPPRVSGFRMNPMFSRGVRLSTEPKSPRTSLQRWATTSAFLQALDAKDPYTAAHSEQVGRFAAGLARRLGLDSEEIGRIRLAAVLHDVGKIGIPDSVLNKPTALTRDEFDLMKQHPAMGVDILKPLPFLEPILPLVLHHHEWSDGSGYPNGRRDAEIPFGARVIQVADCVDAMMSPRCYRRALPLSRVISELASGSGVQFSAEIADVAIEWLETAPPIGPSRETAEPIAPGIAAT